MALFKSTAKFLDTQILVCFFYMQAGVSLCLTCEISKDLVGVYYLHSEHVCKHLFWLCLKTLNVFLLLLFFFPYKVKQTTPPEPRPIPRLAESFLTPSLQLPSKVYSQTVCETPNSNRYPAANR